MADIYTTTKDPLRQMICSSCGGHFAGDSHNIAKDLEPKVVFCDNCLRQRREFNLAR